MDEWPQTDYGRNSVRVSARPLAHVPPQPNWRPGAFFRYEQAELGLSRYRCGPSQGLKSLGSYNELLVRQRIACIPTWRNGPFRSTTPHSCSAPDRRITATETLTTLYCICGGSRSLPVCDARPFCSCICALRSFERRSTAGIQSGCEACRFRSQPFGTRGQSPDNEPYDCIRCPPTRWLQNPQVKILSVPRIAQPSGHETGRRVSCDPRPTTLH